MMRAALLSVIGVLMLGAAAHAQPSIYHGNDTGGIIPWSPENERASFDIATAQCARWNKFPIATSISRRPGDYIAYKCVWDPPRVVVRHQHRRVDVTIDK